VCVFPSFSSNEIVIAISAFTNNDEEKLGESLEKDRSKHQEIMNNFSHMLVNSKARDLIIFNICEL
jgi:hypothetical protein